MDLDIYDIARRGTTKEMKAFIKSGIDLNKKINMVGPLYILRLQKEKSIWFLKKMVLISMMSMLMA